MNILAVFVGLTLLVAVLGIFIMMWNEEKCISV